MIFRAYGLRTASFARSRRVITFVVLALTFLGAHGLTYGLSTVFSVRPTVETAPVPSDNDAADDIAVWTHPTDPAKSRIIGVDKGSGLGKGGLLVYNLDGTQRQYLQEGALNNVDIRYNFPLNGQLTDLIVASNVNNDSISIYRIQGDGFVQNVSINGVNGIPTGIGV